MLPQAIAIAAVPARRIVLYYCRCAPRLLHHVGKQTEKARPLDRPRQLALLLGRYRGDAARHDLAALGDKALQQPHVLVVDLGRVRAGEWAGFAPAKERPPRCRGRATATRFGPAFHLRLHPFGGRRDGGGRLARVAAFAIAVAVAAARPVLAAAAVLHD